ncbi:ADP-ribosylglycohydrolase family protein [Aquimarina algiphila]|uniref:ADP-ribosylglycohydrolase family protein n=1 Tax=Aquimarina algiphila TaxID=2047982 RepID=UPI002330E252|nr:ADP-ribosylglycohydrolase family protein [Aquimarina algiphila]
MISKKDSFQGAIILGAIGDAMGSAYENQVRPNENVYYLFGKPKEEKPKWGITDDTQLTIATCQALIDDINLDPNSLVKHFVALFSKGKIRGIGASTLKAFRELQIGGHWSQVGRVGEYAAGNGAAMRIAPLAFFDHISRERIEEICSITHKNTEAYVGALSILICIKKIINNNWFDDISLMELIIDELPDSRVRDRIIELNTIPKDTSIMDVAMKYGNNGYVVNSVPLVIFAANKIKEKPIDSIFKELIDSEGDTDTNCSMAGHIIGAHLGVGKIPKHLLNRLEMLEEYPWIIENIEKLGNKL